MKQNNISGLPATIRELLDQYRSCLEPGVHYFIGNYAGGRLDNIKEMHVPFTHGGAGSVYSVVFGYFEHGCPPFENATEDSAADFPFVRHVGATSAVFQEKLTLHLKARITRHLAAGREPFAADGEKATAPSL